MSFASDTADLLEATTTSLSPTTSTAPHKHFLGKFGLRKPSVLSLSSAASSTNSPCPTKRSVSPLQDDEKRKILKMLISPNSERKSSKDISEFMLLADQTIKAARSAENLCTGGQVLRQESTHSLQVPLHNMGRKVTFSQVVDHLACSLSDSSSLSDISCGDDFRQSVVSGTTSTSARRNRKMYKPSRRTRPRRPSRGDSSYHGTSGSEEIFESSLESIESYNNFQLKPLSLSTQHRTKINKISSADSLLSMIRNLASSRLNTSTPSVTV